MAQFTAVHQLTHAVFFSPRPWIYEGLAHFAQAAYRERESGRDAALDFMGLHRTAVAEAEKALADAQRKGAGAADSPVNSSVVDTSLVGTSIEEFYRSKAMYVWWMLRDMIGGNVLKKALAGYRPDSDNAPSYLQHLIEAQSKRDLGWFFDDWVYRDRGLPDFRVSSAYPRKMSGSNYIVTVTVENRGNAGAEVVVTLKMEDRQVTKRLEVRAKSEAVIRIESASTPQEIDVNDGSVPESDMSNNVYKIEIPEKSN
jgi:aminopeptidase N